MSTKRVSEDVGRRASLLAFGHLLKRLRLAADLTQEELAERAMVSARSISDLERGSGHRPRRDTVQLLADGLGLRGTERDSFIALARGRSVDAAPAAATASRARHNLPHPPAPIIGRLKETAAATALMHDSDVRLLTLTGPGGVGKTRLALDVAWRVVEALPDGAAFVDLAPLRDPELVLSTIAQALEIVVSPETLLRQAVHAALREKRLLLLIDNFEHVGAAAVVVADLLAACPLLMVLATSRIPLRIRAEREYALGPLALPEKAHLQSLAELARVPAVELFVQRAEGADPGFALTAENARQIAEVVARLDGLPLAIELAANRTKTLSPAALLARMEQRLSLLTQGARDLPSRQQALRATLDWSHDLLSAEEQALFRRLAVFAGGCSLDAAEYVGGAGSLATLDLLAALVDKSLLRTQVGPQEERRFGMLETIREYGLERLEEAGEAADARERHLQWCLHLADQAADALYGSAQAEWLARLALEHDNFRVALGWALAGNDGARGQRLGGVLARFWHLHGHFEEGRRWLEQALALTIDVPPAVRAHALLGLGRLAYQQGDYEARSSFEEALAIYRAIGERAGIANALGALGMLIEDLGEHARADELEEEALLIFRELGDQPGIVRLLVSRGLAAYDLGDYSRAGTLLEEALSRARSLGSGHTVAQSLNNLALVAHAQRDIDRAVTLQTEALAVWHELGNMDGLAHCLENFAMFATVRDELERAASLFGAAYLLRSRIGAPGRPSDLDQLGQDIAVIRARLGEERFAESWANGEAMSLDEALGHALREKGE